MKYLGSKTRFKKEICEIINRMILENDINVYVEPFVGGANIIDAIQCKHRIGYDNNTYLIALYNSLKNGYVPLDFISRELYYKIKERKHAYPKEEVALCGIMASYNGNWFRSYGGSSNTKSGKVRNFYQEGVNGLMKQLPNLMEIDFKESDYRKIKFLEKTLIYCDPPYSTGDRNTYSKNGFDHYLFYKWCRERKKEGHIILVSEYNMPSDFECIWQSNPQKTFAKAKQLKIEKLFIL